MPSRPVQRVINGMDANQRTECLMRLAEALSQDVPDNVQISYRIDYDCPVCGRHWQEIWTAACDATCPNCQKKNISPSDYEEADPRIRSALTTLRHFGFLRTKEEQEAETKLNKAIVSVCFDLGNGASIRPRYVLEVLNKHLKIAPKE